MELSVNKSKRERAGRVSLGDEMVMENHSTGVAHGDRRPARTPSSPEQRSSLFCSFYAAVIQHVAYVTDFSISLVELYILHGKRSFAIFRHGNRGCAATCRKTREHVANTDICKVFFGSIDSFYFHCTPTGRHSDGAPDNSRVRLCSRC